MDKSHLQEEQNLARMMQAPKRDGRAQFSELQWKASKREFWSLVGQHMGNSPKLLVNVGCGYDSGACQFQAAGHTCIHFDMVADMLVALQETAGAISCVAGDANSLPLKKGVFDVLVSVDVIHHEQERVLGLLESFRDLLKPGGACFSKTRTHGVCFRCTSPYSFPSLFIGAFAPAITV